MTDSSQPPPSSSSPSSHQTTDSTSRGMSPAAFAAMLICIILLIIVSTAFYFVDINRRRAFKRGFYALIGRPLPPEKQSVEHFKNRGKKTDKYESTFNTIRSHNGIPYAIQNVDPAVRDRPSVSSEDLKSFEKDLPPPPVSDLSEMVIVVENEQLKQPRIQKINEKTQKRMTIFISQNIARDSVLSFDTLSRPTSPETIEVSEDEYSRESEYESSFNSVIIPASLDTLPSLQKSPRSPGFKTQVDTTKTYRKSKIRGSVGYANTFDYYMDEEDISSDNSALKFNLNAQNRKSIHPSATLPLPVETLQVKQYSDSPFAKINKQRESERYSLGLSQELQDIISKL